MSSKIASVQWLRGIAALMVVIAHIEMVSVAKFHQPLPALQKYGVGGVDIFFVISGFIMLVTTANAYSQRDFLLKRLTRIAPTYWIYTTILFMAGLALPSLFLAFHPTASDLLCSFFFIPYATSGAFFPLLGVGWTLNYEMFFYLVFSFIRLSPQWVGVRTLAVLGTIVAIGHFFPVSNALIFYSSPIILEFAFGCLIGQLWLNNLKVPKVLSLACGIIGVLGFFLLPAVIGFNELADPATAANRIFTLGVPAALILFAAVFYKSPIWNNGVMLLLGEISFSVYLTHTLTIRVLGKLFHASDLSLIASLIYIGVFVTIITVVAWVAYRLIESPITAVLHGQFSGRRTQQMPSPGTG